MKKVFTKIVVLFLLTCVVFSFCACNKKDETKLPSTTYEKVQFALNGVANSLKSSDSKKATLHADVISDKKPIAFAKSAPITMLMAKTSAATLFPRFIAQCLLKRKPTTRVLNTMNRR